MTQNEQGEQPPTTVENKAHHAANGFQNPYLKTFHKSLPDVLKMRWTSNWANHRALKSQVPQIEVNLERLHTPFEPYQVTWIGHSTFLIQCNGRNILTDPVFSRRASPVSFAGPKRYTPPAISIDDLPTIDFALISHNHYDHMDLKSIIELGDGPTWFVPLGNATILQNVGITKIKELDWWDRVEMDDLEFVATPAQHWSARGLFDRLKSLWSGWAVRAAKTNFYFAGDTGYNPYHFKEIGQRLGPFDAAFIPIGAYEPRWFMKPVHLNPEEAVLLHQDVQSRRSFAMHWGTFPLTAEAPGDPPKKLAEALRDAQISQQDFIALKIGETVGA